MLVLFNTGLGLRVAKSREAFLAGSGHQVKLPGIFTLYFLYLPPHPPACCGLCSFIRSTYLFFGLTFYTKLGGLLSEINNQWLDNIMRKKSMEEREDSFFAYSPGNWLNKIFTSFTGLPKVKCINLFFQVK